MNYDFEGRKREKSSRVPSERLKEIPLTWFVGIGRKDTGILGITFSEEFSKLGGKELEKHIAQYGYFMGNTFINHRFPFGIGNFTDLVKDSSEIEDSARKSKVELAEKRIKEITNFTAVELWEKLHDLTRLYKDKKEAAINVELYEQKDDLFSTQ